MKIEGRVVLVTGAASGIGAACAAAFADRGAFLHLIDMSADGVAAAAAELPGGPHRRTALDVTDGRAVAELFVGLAAAGADLGVVVNAAGIVSGGEAWPATDFERIARVLTVNATAVAVLTTLATTYGGRRPRAVVNVGSAASVYPLPPDPIYAMSKAAVLHLTRSAAPAAAAFDVRISAVLPGVVDTPLLATTGSHGVADWLRPRLDGPVLRADAVASAVVELVTSDVSGEAWRIDVDPDDFSQARRTPIG